MYDSTEGQCDMTLGRELLTAVVFDLKVFEQFISRGDGPY